MEHGNIPYHNSGPTNGSSQQRAPVDIAPPPNYQSQTKSNAPTPGSGSDNVASPATSVVPPQQQAFNHLDLELIHYYSTQTYMTLTSKLEAHLVWRDVIFKQGLKHNFLLHALMATAALHKATNHAEDSDTHAAYVKVAFSYQNAALAGYIPALSNPSEDNAVALFILSALLTIWLFGSKKLPEALNSVTLANQPNLLHQVMKPGPDNEPADFLEILTLVQGINAVVKQTVHWLYGGDIGPLLTPPQDNELPPNPPDIEASFQKIQYRIDNMRALQPGLSESALRERSDIYHERLNALRQVSRVRTLLQHDQQIFAWPVTSDPPFIELIKQREPVAIALFVHWAACFKCLDYQWWAKGWSFRLVKEAASVLDESWADVVAWPRKEVGLE